MVEACLAESSTKFQLMTTTDIRANGPTITKSLEMCSYTRRREKRDYTLFRVSYVNSYMFYIMLLCENNLSKEADKVY